MKAGQLGRVSPLFLLGLLTLTTGTLIAQEPAVQAVAVFAVVGDRSTGAPIVGAFVRINGELVRVTDDVGRFRVYMDPGYHRIDVRRIGYAGQTLGFHLEAKEAVQLSVALDPIVYQMPEIVVRGGSTRMVFGSLRSFYRRVGEGTGHYILRDEIVRRSPRAVSDLLRHVPGLEVNQVGIEAAQVRVFPRRGLCEEPLIFLDGIAVAASSPDVVADPEQIEGVEIYTRPLNIPPEFSKQGSNCGVIAIWTR